MVTLRGPLASGIRFTMRNIANWTAGSVTPLPELQAVTAMAASDSQNAPSRTRCMRMIRDRSCTRQSTEGSEILSDDALQRGARTGDVDRVLVTRGKHYAGQLEDRCRRPGNVEIELIGCPRVRGGVEIQVRRRGIHGESGYLLAEVDEHIERGAGSGFVDNPHPCGPDWRRDIVVLQPQRGQCSGGPTQRD